MTAGLLFYSFLVPVLARNIATGILQDLGLKDVELDVHSVTASGLYATNLREASEQLDIAAMTVDYDVADLIGGRVDTITLVGVEWEMGVRDGQITIAPFDALLPPSNSDPAGDLPLQTLRLRSSSVGIDCNGYRLRLPVEATITHQGRRRFAVDMSLDLLGTPLTIAGSVKPQADSEGREQLVFDAELRYLKTPWKATARANARSGTVEIDANLAEAAGDPIDADSRRLAIQVLFHRQPDGSSVALDVRAKQKSWRWAIFGDQLEALDLDARLQLALDDEFQITELIAHFTSASLSWNQQALSNVAVRLDQKEGRLEGLAQAAADGWTGKATADAPSLRRLVSGNDYDVHGSWQLNGKLPRWLARRIESFGWRLDQHDDAKFSGAMTAHVRGTGTGPLRPEDPLPWRIVSDNITLTLGSVDLQASDETYRIEGLRGELRLLAEATPHTFRWRLKPESKLAFTKALLGRPSSLTLGGNSFAFGSPDPTAQDLDLNQLSWDRSQGSWRCHLFAALDRPAHFEDEAFEANLRHLTLDAVIGPRSHAPPKTGERPQPVPAAIHIAFDQSSFHSRRYPVEATNIAATVPLGINGAPVDRARFSIDDIRYLEQSTPAIQGHARYHDGEIQLDAQWQPFTHAAVKAQASIDLKPQHPTGQITFSTPKFQWTDADQELVKRWFPAIGDLAMEGSLAVDGRVDLAHGRSTPDIRISTDDLTLQSRSFDIAALGIAGSVTLNGLTPLSTPGRQRLRIEELQVGKMDLREGTFAFRVEDPDSIFIERTTWSWGEKGRFYVHAFRYQPSLDEYDVEVFVENLDLNDWIDALTEKHVDGTGLLYGRLPISIRPRAQTKITFGRGFLYAQPLAGSLQVRDTELIRRILVSSDPRFGTDETMKQVMDQIVDAMRDFEYDRLAFDFIPRPEHNDLQLRINAGGQGRGRDGRKGVPVEDLTVNLNGIDKLINESLFWKRGSENAIEDALTDFFRN